MANATMQALQTHAEKLNQQVAEVNASIKALGDVPDDSPALLEYRKQLRRLNSDLKDVNTTMKDYSRGVKAAGELYRHYAMGNIEDMSIKAIRAGVNGMKKRLDNLKAGGDPGDAEEMRLIEAITTEADVVVKRFKTDYQHVVEEIARGGTVTEQTLKRTRDGLADLMQTAETEAEKNELTNYWQKVGAAIEAVAVENRRLRGEVADREEAMRIAYATDHDGSQQAIHDAEARADAARRENDELRQRLDLKQQQRRELEQEMDINSMQQRSLMDRRDELKAQEKEDRAIRNQRVDDANKELSAARRAAKTQQQAYDEQKQTVGKLRTEVQGLTDDIRKLGEVKAEPKIDTSEIDAKLEELRGSLSRVQQMKSTAQEKIASAKEVLGDTDKPWNNERVKKALEEDRVTQEENIAKLNAKWDEYWEKQERNAREFAATLNKIAVDDVDWDEFYTHVTGPNAELAKSWYRVEQRNLRGVDYWGEDSDNYKELVSLRASKKLGSASDGMLEELKLLEALKRKWDEYQKALNKAREESPKYDAAYNELDKARVEIIQQERLLETYTEHERQLKEQIAETEKLSQAQQQSTTATTAQTEAYQKLEKQLSDAKRDLAEIAEDERKANEALKQFGITTADITDDAKLQAAAEKALKEEEESRLELAKQMLQVRKQIGQEELKDSRIVGSKDTQAFYAKNKGVLDDEYWKGEAGGGSISRMYKYLNDISDDPEAKAEFKEQVGMTVKDAMRVAGQRMREVVQEAMKRGIKIDDALSDFADGYGHGPATKIEEFMREFNETVGDKEDELIKKRREKLDAIADVVYEPGEEMASRDERLRLAKESLKGVGEGYYGSGKSLSESYKEQQAEVTRLESEMKKLSETSQQSAQSSEQLAQKQEQLSQKTAELNQQQDKLNGMVGETVTANQRLARAEQEQTDARNAQAEAKKHEGEAVKKVEDELRGLTDEQLKNAQAYSHLTEEINADTAAMQRNITTEQEATREADRLRSGSIDKMEQALARLRESNRKLDPTIDKEEWERGERAIGQINLRLEELKKQSAELRREPVLDMMTQRMDQLGTLSRDALTETKKFWETMVAGAEKGSGELAEYEQHLKSIALEEQARVREQGREAFAFFQREDYRRTNAADTEEQRKALVAYRDALPADAIDHIEAINALLEKHAQFVKEAAGEWMSLEKAMELASKAGTDQFAGSAKDIQLATQSLERQRDTIIATIREKRNLGQATKAEEDQLADLTKKLRSLKFEQDNVNMSQEKMRMLIETPANAVNLDELRAAIKRADGQLRQMEQSLGQNSGEYKRFAEQVRQAKNVMKEMEGQAKASATAWEKAFSRLKTYVVMYMGFNEVWQKVSNTARDLMDLSDRMGEVRKTTGFTADEVGRLSENLKKMDVRTSLTSLMEISASAGQLGLKTLEDVQGFTEAANKLMIALPEMGREAATEMMRVAIATGEVDKIRKQLQEGTIEGSSATAVAMEKIASTIDRLRASSASTAPEITDFVKRVGAVGAQSGITIDQVAALGSTVSSLGMRVEMSATALSRMIPAIRRNAFDVAHAIGMAPEALRKMFDEAGGGMNAMLEIFQHIKDAGMDEDDIEKMLGVGDMTEIMKELNQQGARAGIVFAGLSQNVDELRAQLGTAADAYEKNIAVQQEFERMNETTAAKWERLKNQFEEMWVGDGTQGALGTLIDMLRSLVDFISGNVSPALQAVSSVLASLFVGFVAFRSNIGSMIVSLAGAGKAMQNWRAAVSLAIGDMGRYIALKWQLVFAHDAEAKAAIRAKLATTAATKAMLSNVVLAFVAAIGLLVWKLIEVSNAMDKVDEELARMETETEHAIHNVGNLTRSLTTSIKATDEARKKQEGLKSETEALRKEVDKLTKSSDNSTEAKDKLSQKTDELKQKEKELKAAEDESNKANSERLKLIGEINSKYSTYLGYMLSEATTAEKVASAHQLIVAALKEELRQKGINRKQEAIDQKYADKEAEYSKEGWDELEKLPRATQQRIMDAWTEVRASVTSDVEKDKNGKVTRQTYTLADIPGLKASGKTFNSEAELNAYMRKALTEIVGREVPTEVKNGRRRISLGGNNYYDFEGFIKNIWGDNLGDDGFGDWASTTISKQAELARTLHEDQITQNTDHRKTVKAAVNDINTSFSIISKTTTGNQDLTAKQINTLAENVNAIVTDLQKYGDDIKGVEKYVGKDSEGEANAVSLENAVATMFADRDEKTRQRILKAARRASRTSSGGGGATSTTDTGTNIWGSNAPADSTDYSLFDVNELVARRNQMDKFKNILKPDTDVRTVLAEDKALMKALDNGLKSDWKSVLDWYNAERKKIQEELKSERFSTNTGHWRDEKNGRGRKNRFRESDYALAELDRYYSRRKEKLEKAREEEGMSEELFNREAELLEQEHLERRSKLRETFTAGTSKQEQEMVKQFRQWWDKLEKSGDLDEVPWATVESEWAKALASEIGRNNLKAQQDLTQLQSITVKHLNAIAKLIDQERPYDGITANLRKNLTEMDILLADMVKDGPAEDTAKLVSEQGKRLQFLLTEAEHAYALTFDDLAKKMREQGLGDWADALMIDEQKKQSLMQNLRNVYDQIQEAIKKEASIIKKQLEIQWNDMLPGQDMSMKGTFEKAISDLGLAGDQVKRANSLIGAGAASERVADRLAIQQMKVQLAMQQTYFALMQKIGDERVRQLRLSAEANDRDAKALKAKAEQLRREGKITEAETKEREAEIAARRALQDSFDAEHAQKSLNLAKTKEIAEEEKQRVAIQNQLEESQNRLYTSLRSWADLLTSSLQGVMEASHAGDAEYYNERAKLNLTGKGGPGAGTYVVIDDAGTSNAKAHYEYLDERQALERQHEIEVQNAQAEAWRKLMDDINMKMSEQITDWMNAALQQQAVNENTAALKLNTDAEQRHLEVVSDENGIVEYNTDAVLSNTSALQGLTQQLMQGITIRPTADGGTGSQQGGTHTDPDVDIPSFDENDPDTWPRAMRKRAGLQVDSNPHDYAGENAAENTSPFLPGVTPGVSWTLTEEQMAAEQTQLDQRVEMQLDAAEKVRIANEAAFHESAKTEKDTGNQMAKSSKSTFAKMAAAANMYGIAYQAMSNENLSTTQKFQAIALQTIGSMTIAGLEALKAEMIADAAAKTPGVLGKLWSQLGWAAAPVFAIFTGLLGGLMGLATSKISSSKSQIAQATGASVSVGRLATGMLTYAEGNVNELTDPASLTPGRQYNVDGADGKTYRARYMGKGAKTHITNGPEFHLVGEAGPEAIIDAKTTRLMRMDDTGIWRDIQTLYNGGSISGLSPRRRRSTGVRAFADGNIGEFEDMADGGGLTVEETGGMSIEMLASLQASIDRQSDLLENALVNGIKAVNKWTGSDGIPAMYNKMQKEAQRHGEKYL